jgi:hypothetical protein
VFVKPELSRCVSYSSSGTRLGQAKKSELIFLLLKREINFAAERRRSCGLIVLSRRRIFAVEGAQAYYFSIEKDYGF